MANDFPELTPEIIAELKTKHPGRPLFSVEIQGMKFVFTYLTQKDAIELSKWTQENPNAIIQELDEKIVSIGLLWPELTPMQWMTVPAGVMPAVSRAIQEKSLMDVGAQESGVSATVVTLVDFAEQDKPADEDLEKIKKAVPHPLRLVSVCGGWYVVRPIMRLEFNTIRNKASADTSLDLDQEMSKVCTVFPKDVNWDAIPAGVASALSKQIVDMSGFNDNAAVVSEL